MTNTTSSLPHVSDSTGTVERVGRSLVEAWNTHDPTRVAALYAADFVGADVAEAHPVQGREGVQRRTQAYLSAFPDLRFTLEEEIVGQDQAVVVWQARGTQRGPVLNIPRTDRQIAVRGVWVLSVSDGEIKRGTCIWDVAGLIRGLGLLPDL